MKFGVHYCCRSWLWEKDTKVNSNSALDLSLYNFSPLWDIKAESREKAGTEKSLNDSEES